MSEIWKGKPVADALDGETAQRVEALKNKGITPTLGILRVGAREDDLSYERGAVKRCEKLGIAVQVTALPADADQAGLMAAIRALSEDSAVHGILMLRPLPRHLDETAACQAIAPEKDVDGVTRASMASLYAGTGEGFAPCTAEACLALLEHYGYELTGKWATVVGRSLVIGKPVAMLLNARNATVTLCHSRTPDLPAVVREADLVVAALGKREYLGADCFRPGQSVLDVGIHWSEEKQRLVGDVAFEEAGAMVESITPVPGGVGSVTTAILARHVVLAAERSIL